MGGVAFAFCERFYFASENLRLLTAALWYFSQSRILIHFRNAESDGLFMVLSVLSKLESLSIASQINEYKSSILISFGFNKGIFESVLLRLC